MSKRKLDKQIQVDVDFVAALLANGISGLIQVGIADGLKLKGALERIMKSKANTELFASTVAKYIEVNPRAADAIELLAAMSPKFGEILERLRLKPKDVDAEDVEVREEKEG